MDNRLWDHPSYQDELQKHGFVNTKEHFYCLSLHRDQLDELSDMIIQNWASGFEAYSLELMNRHLKRCDLQIFLDCARARADLKTGIDGVLKM